MKLIQEINEDVQYIVEKTEEGKKSLFIEGTFMVYGQPNKNGRIYSENVMRNEVNRYTKEVIESKRAYGELNHPQGPTINLDRVSHLIEKLDFGRNGKVCGRAKILETPMGNIVKGLLEGGANLGVSTRGLGSLREGKNGIMEVQDDFRLVTAADIVADPSAPGAFVQGIMEGVDWVWNEKIGEWVEDTQKEMKKLSKRELEEKMINYFDRFLKTL